ncbi:MAG: phenylalanine--tRNA ligase subunit beta [Emticicia sp.]|nr:phenylalanine--tRNA ligase subunit beta [Emticicia sp.]
MKISYNWLKSLIEIKESAEEIGKLLTATGLEVEGIEEIESIKGGLKGFVVGEVLTCETFMVKEKSLSLTTVSIGAETPSTIVCGAGNVRAGQKVIIATLGTTIYLADNQSFTIEKRKVYGHPSEGMICAEDEIGTGHSHDGILVLDTALANGTPAIEYFKSIGKSFEADYQIEIGLTPNRADAASHLGVARDLRAVLDREIKMPSIENFKPTTQISDFQVVIENSVACPRFCGLEIRGITVKESPEWLKNALLAIGLNPISNIVDITNYICHTLGQPMHAFDADEVKGHKIVVRVPEEGTKFTTLDGTERTLSGKDLMVCNETEPMAIAGVFGGQKSGIKPTTQNVFLEVAYFNPTWVRKTATFHGLKTDASFRYERGTDPNMPPFAIRLAAVLIQELAGGDIIGEPIDVYPNPIANFEISVKHKNINRLIGKNLDDRLIHKILKSLDIEILSDNGNEMQVSVPPYSVDVTREADVIEEILRIYGFENIELSETLSTDYLSSFAEKDADKLQFQIIELLAANSFNEIQTLSITKPAYNQALVATAKGETVTLLNPLSEELSVMRSSLLLTGMESVAYNINRRQKDLKLFEFGRSYFKKDDKYKENKHLGIWMTGNRQSESWASPSTALAFHDLALVVQKVLKAMKVAKFDTQEADLSVFQYGLTYLINKKPVVSLGLVKPQLSKLADVKQAVFYADFDWEYLLKQYSGKVAFVEIPKFPEVRRDLSIVIDSEVKFEQVSAIAAKTEKNLLQSINVFDVYAGEKLDAGKKSYSVSFMLIDKEKTLTDDVIDKTMQRLIAAYEKELGAVIRK